MTDLKLLFSRQPVPAPRGEGRPAGAGRQKRLHCAPSVLSQFASTLRLRLRVAQPRRAEAKRARRSCKRSRASAKNCPPSLALRATARRAGVAQWKCKRFVNERLGVRIPPLAPRFAFGYAWRTQPIPRLLHLALFVHSAGRRFGKAERQDHSL
jgi:hypothetical protein